MLFPELIFGIVKKWLLLFSIVLLLALLWLQPAWAHGGGELQIAAVDGPFKLSVWSNPPRARVEETVHITVGLADPTDGNVILDGDVAVVVRDEEGQVVKTTAATTEQSVNKLFYETDFILSDPGQYDVEVTAQNDAGMGQTRFSLIIVEALGRAWVVWALIFLGVFAGALLAHSWKEQPEKRPLVKKKQRA